MDFALAGAAGVVIGALGMLAWLAMTGKPTPPSADERASDVADLSSIRAALAQADREAVDRPRVRYPSPLPTMKGTSTQ